MLFIYGLMIFGAVLLLISAVYIATLNYYLNRDAANVTASSLTANLLSSDEAV